MQTCIVRQPIMNREKKVAAYEVLFQEDESSLYNQQDSRAANAIQDFFMGLDQNNFLGDKDAFITFTPNLLMKNIPRIFSEHRLVIQIEDNVIVHPLAQRIICRYKKQGYRVALMNFEFTQRCFGILDDISIIKIDFSNPEDPKIRQKVMVARSFGKQVAAYNVNTEAAIEKANELAVDFYQGENVANLLSTNVHRMDHLQSNFFQLMVAVTKEEPNLDEIERIISQDVTLTYSLLKMVNSSYFALRNKVKSVMQALTILGVGQLKQWVYLMSFSGEDDSVNNELIRTAFLRGSMCQALVDFLPDFPLSRSESYLLGMFSTLDTLLQVPLENAMEALPVADELKQGLLTGEGEPGALLRLVIDYENADWRGVSEAAKELNLSMTFVAQKYLECVEYVNDIWQDLMHPFEDQVDQDEKPAERVGTQSAEGTEETKQQGKKK